MSWYNEPGFIILFYKSILSTKKCFWAIFLPISHLIIYDNLKIWRPFWISSKFALLIWTNFVFKIVYIEPVLSRNFRIGNWISAIILLIYSVFRMIPLSSVSIYYGPFSNFIWSSISTCGYINLVSISYILYLSWLFFWKTCVLGLYIMFC